jgi:hypothetical protein
MAEQYNTLFWFQRKEFCAARKGLTNLIRSQKISAEMLPEEQREFYLLSANQFAEWGKVFLKMRFR